MDTASFWLQDAQQALKEKVKSPLNRGRAKNIIFFIGDGMSIETITAGRIFNGQMEGKLGERSKLSFEKFPYVGLSKVDLQRVFHYKIKLIHIFSDILCR